MEAENVTPIRQDGQQPAKVIALPATRAGLAWDRATDALVTAADGAEATAKARYEAAKSEYQAARQNAHMIRQLRQLARIDGTSVGAETESATKRWSRNFEACVNCGSTEYKHASRGYCKRGACEKANKANREAQHHV